MFIPDRGSVAVDGAIQRESAVVVSPLTELETFVQIKAHCLGGGMGTMRYARTCERLAGTLSSAPFVKRALASRIFPEAIKQHATSSLHCRSLDRLHLAAMAELGVRRLMTHDLRQAEAAKELGYEVLMPDM